MKKLLVLLLVSAIVQNSFAASAEVAPASKPLLGANGRGRAPVAPVSKTKPALSPASKEQTEAERQVLKERAEIVHEIAAFKKEQISEWEGKIARIKNEVKGARDLFNEQSRNFKEEESEAYLGALAHWVTQNARLQEAEATLAYVKELPEDMVLPVTELKKGIVQARESLTQLDKVNKESVNLALDAYTRRVAKEKGSDNKSPEFANALKQARDGMATYYEVLGQSYASLEVVFADLWQQSANNFAQQKQAEIEDAEHKLGRLVAIGKVKGFTGGGEQELTTTATPLPSGADPNELVAPQLPEMLIVDLEKASENQQKYKQAWDVIHARLVAVKKQKEAIWQGGGTNRLVGKRELIEQRKADWEMAEKIMSEQRNQPGTLSDESHPFQKAAVQVKICQESYELDLGRFDAQEMVRQVHEQIVQAARDIRLIDENTPMATEQSRKGMQAFDREIGLFKTPGILGGNRLINRVTGQLGKFISQFKMMEPIKNDFENRIGYLRQLFPQMDLVISGCRWLVRSQAPGLL